MLGFILYHGNAFCFDGNFLCVLGVEGKPYVSLYIGSLYWLLQRAALTSVFSILHMILFRLSPPFFCPNTFCYPLLKTSLSVVFRFVVIKELLVRCSHQ